MDSTKGRFLSKYYCGKVLYVKPIYSLQGSWKETLDKTFLVSCGEMKLLDGGVQPCLLISSYGLVESERNSATEGSKDQEIMRSLFVITFLKFSSSTR